MSRRALSDQRVAFVFPGVGVRLCGYEPDFFDRHRQTMTPVLEEASSFADFDYGAALGDGDRLAEMTELQGQLFTYAFNCAVAAVFKGHDVMPELMAGHSMGIYSALSTAGVIAFSDGLEVVTQAFEIVSEAASGLDAGMAVVVGLSRDDVDELLARPDTGSTVCRVNENNDTTAIFAGSRQELEAFADEARRHDALKARLLPVRAPYHHPALLTGAIERFQSSLKRYEWSRACCPIVSSIDQQLLVEPRGLLDLTARNIATPINWEAVFRTIVAQEIETVIECGAGISLHQNGRLMHECPRFVTVKNASRRAGL